jgi:aspartyl aminopeptidase
MIEHDHENESSQTTSAKDNLNRISQITSHIPRQDAKHVIDILSQQTVSVLTTDLTKPCKKKKIAASEKAYNRHVLEEKQFTNKTSTFIHYRLLFQKYEHDSIFS